MISQCPECKTRLTDFAVSCSCGWSMVDSTESIATSGILAADNSVRIDPNEVRIKLKTLSRKKQTASAVSSHGGNGSSIQATHSANGTGSKNKPPSSDLQVNGHPPSDSSIDLGSLIDSGNNASDSQTSLVINSDSVESSRNGSDDDDDSLPPSKTDLQIQKAKELIGEEEFSKSHGYLSRAIADAPTERLAECFSLRGYVYYRQGDVVNAEAECTKAIQQNWEDANTYAWRAAARGEQNKWRLAFDDLQSACDIAGSNRDEYFRLMDSYRQAAKSYFQEQIRSGTDSADLFCERGWVYYRCSKPSKAERDFKQALQRDDKHGWASMGLAMVHREAGVHQHLSKLLESALAGDLDCQRLALQNCAELHFAKGDVTAANKDLARLTHLAGGDSQSIVDVCRIRSNMGDHIQAIDQISTLVEDTPEEHFAWLVRGQCYRAIKNYPLAVKDYSRFLRFFPEHMDALVGRADCFVAMRKYNRAHEDLDVAEEVNETHYGSRLLRAKLMLIENQLDSALTECVKAIRLDNRAEAFGTKAKIFHKLCDYSAAIEEYSRAIEMSHDDMASRGEYLYQRGTLLYELEDFTAAFRDFDESCVLRPNHSGGWIWNAATASRLERWPEAIDSLQHAIESRPAASSAYQKLGRPVAKKAVDFFDRQQQRSQATIATYRNRGMAHQFLGNHKEAIKDFTIALKQEPGDVDVLIRRGQVLAEQDRHKEADADFTQVIQAEPKNHLARYCRAISRKANGKLQRATTDIRKAILISPEHPKYHILLSEIHLLDGNTSKVIRSLDKAVLRDPTDPLTYRRRAAVHVSAGDLLRAIRDYTHAIELDPTQFDSLVSRGQAHLKSGQLGLAMEDFELALTHNPKLAKAYSGRATALVADEKFEYTLIWLTKAIHRFEEPRDLAEILFARGKVFVQMGRIAPAASDFSAVIDLVRTDPKTLIAARHARALTNIHAQRFEKAIKDYRRILKLNPNDKLVQRMLSWLENPTDERPDFLPTQPESRRPTRPTAVRAGVTLEPQSVAKWKNQPPFDTWIVRTEDNKEYGPVHFNILQTWITTGRIDLGMKLLRADWKKWKRAEKIFPEILPFHGPSNFVDDFPGIQL